MYVFDSIPKAVAIAIVSEFCAACGRVKRSGSEDALSINSSAVTAAAVADVVATVPAGSQQGQEDRPPAAWTTFIPAN
ncbi:uncharacterized protein N7498_002780 [Penicillium cinerascens]|uniref:Uncharacterized protein n=1 Tax=Penicillium cinerascens TaxID=70096 RepID=A0A9W9NAR1_9EURO|nr:uncharacterized protein N7498_002780 [Penicillium cinerascens]KAJ5216373.1 hypothetical protein N7498_002780 [Penicillium cinerascens]